MKQKLLAPRTASVLVSLQNYLLPFLHNNNHIKFQIVAILKTPTDTLTTVIGTKRTQIRRTAAWLEHQRLLRRTHWILRVQRWRRSKSVLTWIRLHCSPRSHATLWLRMLSKRQFNASLHRQMNAKRAIWIRKVRKDWFSKSSAAVWLKLLSSHSKILTTSVQICCVTPYTIIDHRIMLKCILEEIYTLSKHLKFKKNIDLEIRINKDKWGYLTEILPDLYADNKRLK